MEELWKKISGYNGFYEISNSGRVRSIDRVVRNRIGYMRRVRGKMMKIDKYGYVRLSIDGSTMAVKVSNLIT